MELAFRLLHVRIAGLFPHRYPGAVSVRHRDTNWRRAGAALMGGIFACSAIVGALPAKAHKTSLAHLNLDVTENRVDALLVVAVADMAASIDSIIAPTGPVSDVLATGIETYIDRNLHLSIAKGMPCAADANSFRVEFEGDKMEVRRRYTCAGTIKTLLIVYNLFFNDDPTSRAIITAEGPGGKREAMAELSSRTLNVDLVGDGETNRPSFLSLLLLGIEHILTGIDHVMFLLALLLGLPRLGQALAIVTAFTIAHSITLACAWFGLVTLPPRLVETAIAFSIAYVAAENLFGYGLRYRWVIAGGFGLIHGLGFYGVLSELGLEGAGALRVLLGFNLGVELGQLMIIALATPVLLFIRMQDWKGVAVRCASFAFLVVALFWAVERSFA